MKLKYTYSSFLHEVKAYDQWHCQTHLGISDSCIGKGWFIMVSIERLLGIDSSIKCSTCSS